MVKKIIHNHKPLFDIFLLVGFIIPLIAVRNATEVSELPEIISDTFDFEG